jgi:hypothetical protein
MIKLKNKIQDNFRYLNFDKIFSYDVALIKGYKDDKKKTLFEYLNEIYLLLKFFFGTLYRSIFTYPEIKHSKKKKIFFIRSCSASHLISHSISYEKIKGTTVCLPYKRVKEIDIYSLFIGIYLIFKNRKSWIKVFNTNGINLYSISGLKIFLTLFNSFSDAIKIFPILITYSKVVSFQEMRQIENIICQIANLNNIKTFALEHGIGTFKLKGPYWQRIPLTTYTSSVCKNILCWSRFSKILFKKYTKANLYIVGKAALPKKTQYADGVTLVFQNKNWKVANKQLLVIGANLKKNNIPVSYWFKSENLLSKKRMAHDGPLRQIIVGNSSNLLVELGYLGFCVYLLRSSVFLKFLNNNLILATLEKVKKQYFNNITYPHAIWRNFIKCTGKESIKIYKKIVNYNNKKNYN